MLGIESLWQKDKTTLAIQWNDGKIQDVDIIALRHTCPCAQCKERKPCPSLNVTPKEIYSVGQYAIGVRFSDGHKTGIYTYDFLRSLG